ncbi:MAG TPA: hypothetical protein ENG33_08935 [Chloroflexi bacterium]|nr:hypothetical protein [Chloroflexota bacterium]
MAFWRDLSLVLLAFEAFGVFLAIGVACYFTLKGFNWLDVRARIFIPQVRRSFKEVESTVGKASKMVALPFIETTAFFGGLVAAVSALRRRS